MKAMVKSSRTEEFVPGEEFDIVYVYSADEFGSMWFDIFIPDDRYGGKATAFCHRDGCEHLGGGQWAFVFGL